MLYIAPVECTCGILEFLIPIFRGGSLILGKSYYFSIRDSHIHLDFQYLDMCETHKQHLKTVELSLVCMQH